MKNSLQALVEKKGMKLPAFAKVLGKSYQTLYGYAHGDRRMPADFVHSAAEKLGCSPEDILKPPGDDIREESANYQASPTLEWMPPERLKALIRDQVAELQLADNEHSVLLLDALMETAVALKRKVTEK